MGEVASGIKSFQKGMRDEEQKPAPTITASTTTVDPVAQPEKKDA